MSDFTVHIAERQNRDVLAAAAKRHCANVAAQAGFRLPHLTVKVVPHGGTSPHDYRDSVAILGVRATSDDAVLALHSAVAAMPGCRVIIAEQLVGSQVGLSAGQILGLVRAGASGFVREFDFIDDDAVLQLILRYRSHKSGVALLIGEPARRVLTLFEQVLVSWQEGDGQGIYDPGLAFRVACRLAELAPSDQVDKTFEQIADALIRGGFPHNREDTRKAIGALAKVWDLRDRRNEMPSQARDLGFPRYEDADQIYEMLQGISYEAGEFLSASGHAFSTFLLRRP